jgi:hypothetical protein
MQITENILSLLIAFLYQGLQLRVSTGETLATTVAIHQTMEVPILYTFQLPLSESITAVLVLVVVQ